MYIILFIMDQHLLSPLVEIFVDGWKCHQTFENIYTKIFPVKLELANNAANSLISN